MLAINHITLATAGVLTASLYLNIPFFLPFILFVVFASLLPDIDHPNSDMSHIFPVINKAFKHRGVTHSILGTISVLSIFYFLLHNYNQILTYTLLVIGLIGVFFINNIIKKRASQFHHIFGGLFSANDMKIITNSLTWLLAIFFAVLGLLVWRDQFRIEILELVIFGYLMHIVGDFVTIEGVPLFWPWKKMFGLRLFPTGGNIETIVGVILVPVNIFLLYRFYIQFDLGHIDYWRFYLPI